MISPIISSLSIGITDCISSEIMEIAKECSGINLCYQYSNPKGIKLLRELIAKELNEEYLYSFSKENVLITTGAISAVYLSLLNSLKINDEVLVPWPTYFSYVKQIELIGAKPVFFDCFQKNEGEILEDIKQRISSKTKVIILCTPNNPTGKVISENAINKLASACKDENIVLIVDETYSNLIYRENKEITFRQLFENVIRVKSFSKDLGVSGLRVGYIYAEKSFIDKIALNAETLAICPPTLSQEIISKIFQKGLFNSLVKKQKNYLLENLDLICNCLNELKDYFDYKKPEGGMFIFAKLIGVVDDQKFCQDLFETSTVLVSPGSKFSAPGYVRFSFGAKKEEIQEAFKRIQQNIYKLKTVNLGEEK